MKTLASLLIALFLVEPALADEGTRQATIAKIIEAQGLQKMIEQQLDQSRATAGEMGRNIFKKMLSENGIPEGQANPQMEQVFKRYLERCGSMFSSKELVGTWATFYGENLSESELEEILAYYRSPVGKKDVLASQTAMPKFTQTMNIEAQKSLTASVAQLMSDIKAAMAE